MPQAVTVMTRNLFVGADLTPAYEALASADSLASLPGVVAAIFNPGEPPGLVQRTDFTTRAGLLADEIAAGAPDLVGLQEAALWRTRDPSGEVVAYDHLAMLEAELERRGLRYRRVVTKPNGDVELPSAAGVNVGLANREAILAHETVGLADVQTGSFASVLPVETAQGTFTLARGWASVDAEVDGVRLRFISTHLEVAGSATAAEVQRRQAGELIDGPAATALPVVLLGDFNARPGRPAHAALLAAGFDDAWARANPDGPRGLTCCHRMPLDDPADRLRARIDHVFTRGALEAVEAYVVGDEFGDGPLWASDHAGVVARLEPRRYVGPS